LAAVVVVAAVAAFALTRHDAPTLPRLKDDPPLARRHAVQACAHMDTVQGLVGANSSADAVFSAMAKARAEARLAAGHDPRWVPLYSGIEAVQVGLKGDDANAANVGIRSVRAQCEQARA
jgi:cation diffusion facilitator CzcD-associated flavoprotein CzcO